MKYNIIGGVALASVCDENMPVSYTHLTLPTTMLV